MRTRLQVFARRQHSHDGDARPRYAADVQGPPAAMPSVPISKNKIVVPPRRLELLSRPRLLEELSEVLDRKLVLLSAPAGYGKTSLLIDLAHSTQLPVCWLSFDLLDRDPQRFLAYLIASLAAQFGGLAPLQAQVDDLRSIEQDAEALLVAITNDLYEQVEQDFLLILDDFHLLEDAPPIPALLNRFLRLVDENCHVVLSSRTLTDLPDLPLFVGREQVEGLDQTALAFDPHEVQALFDQNYHQHLSDESAAQLVEQTGGWITGMLLSNLPGVTRIAGVDAFGYLGRQVLDQQPAELRTFLLRTSIPEEYSVPLCEAILPGEGSDSARLAAQALDKNLFVQPIGEHGRWLRYHPLFREFLQVRLQAERPEEIRPILERLTAFYERESDWEKAYFTCRQIDDPEALAAIVKKAGPSMARHALVTLENWLNALPPFVLRGRPGLVSLRGVVATEKGNVTEGVRLYTEAETRYRGLNDAAGLALALVRRATARRFLGEYEAALSDVEEALALAELQPDLQIQFAEGMRLKGLILYRLGRSREAVECLERSLALYRNLQQSENIPILLMETAVTYTATGNLETARALYLRALDIWRAEENLQWLPSLYNNLGVLHHQLGEYEPASAAFEQGLAAAARSHNRRGEALLLTGLGDLYSEVQEHETAAQVYGRAHAIASELSDSFILTYLTLARALLLVRQNVPARAVEVLRPNERSLEASPSLYERGLYHLIAGRVQLLQNQPAQAVSQLRKSSACFREDGRVLEGMWSVTWLASALNLAGDEPAAKTELRELLQAQSQNTHALLVALHEASPWLGNLRRDPEIGRSLNGLFERAAKIAARFPAVRRQFRHLAQSIAVPAAGIRVQALGRAQVVVNGRAVTISDWHSTSVRDLFFYVLYRSKPLTREQIAKELWPETEDPKAVRSRFKNELYRLRRVVGKDSILFDEETYRFNPAMDYEYDVEVFESMLMRARAARSDEERLEHLQRAADLVQGPYLEDVQAGWVDEERERLTQLQLTALEELSALYLDHNRIDAAIAASQRGVQVDPYRESLYRIAMRAQAARRDRPAVVRLYQACQAALKNLGYGPSDETRLLFRQLTALNDSP